MLLGKILLTPYMLKYVKVPNELTPACARINCQEVA